MVEPLDLVARYLYSVTGGNEVSTSGFRADPEALSQLAAKFEQAARQLAEEAVRSVHCRLPGRPTVSTSRGRRKPTVA
jgi:hypothetical protein